MSKTNLKWTVLKHADAGHIVIDEVFKKVEEPIDTENLSDDEFIVEVSLVSVDPTQRGWLSTKPSYRPPMKIGDTMDALGAGKVIASKSEKYPVGSHVSGLLGFQKYAKLNANSPMPPTVLPSDLPLELALSSLGMTGMTAYFGLLDIGMPKEGETVVVSGAAGATGNMAGQIAKIKGCRVVGIAGSAEKCEWLKSIGFDVAINYKDEDFAKQLKESCPNGVDVYYDNVGESITDLVLTMINLKARIVVCGAIAMYNSDGSHVGLKNYPIIISKRAKMEGFLVMDYGKRFGEAATDIGSWMKEGKIQVKYTKVQGFDKIPETLLKLFTGDNIGKLMIEI